MSCAECEKKNLYVVNRQQMILGLQGKPAYYVALEQLLKDLYIVKEQCMKCLEQQMTLRGGITPFFENRPSIPNSEKPNIIKHMNMLERTNAKIKAIKECLEKKVNCEKWHR
jgi:hypothetical protein